MEKPAPSPKHILVDLLSIHCQLKTLFKDEEQYSAIIDFLDAKDYYNDPDISYPTLKEVQEATGLSPTHVRKRLSEMYECLFGYQTPIRMDFSRTEYNFYLENNKVYEQFTLSELSQLPRVGEEFHIPFVKASLGTELFYVEKVSHIFESNMHRIDIWLKDGFFNSYWKIRKDEAILKREIGTMDLYKLYEFQLKEMLKLPPY